MSALAHSGGPVAGWEWACGWTGSAFPGSQGRSLPDAALGLAAGSPGGGRANEGAGLHGAAAAAGNGSAGVLGGLS